QAWHSRREDDWEGNAQQPKPEYSRDEGLALELSRAGEGPVFWLVGGVGAEVHARPNRQSRHLLVGERFAPVSGQDLLAGMSRRDTEDQVVREDVAASWNEEGVQVRDGAQ